MLQNPLKFGLIEPYQLITLTPPYEEVIYRDLIKSLYESSLVTENTIVLIEYPEEMGIMPFVIDDKLYGLRNRKYGRTVIATYVYRPTQTFDMKPEEFMKKNPRSRKLTNDN